MTGSKLLPVIEVPMENATELWPVADLAPWSMFELRGGLAEKEIGSVLLAVAWQNRPEGAWGEDVDEVALRRDAQRDEVLGWIVAAEDLTVSGGLRAEDGVGRRVDPACCCDLNEWREWADFADRRGPWLGHSPEPWVEYLETAIRVHPTGGFESEPVAEGFVEIPLADMPGLLLGVQEQLAGFLDAVRAWVGEIAPALAHAVVESLDRRLQVSRRSAPA